LEGNKVKRFLIYALVVMFGVLIYAGSQGYADYPSTGWWMRESELMIGEHVPLIWSGTGTVSGTSSMVFYTPCMQIGYDPDASSSQNKEACTYNPEYFTLDLLLSKYGAGDSVGVTDAKIQFFNESSDTLITVVMRVKGEDTTAVGAVITGSRTTATAIVVSKVTSLTVLLADSELTCYMYPGNIFTTSDSVGDGVHGVGSDVQVVTYTNTGVIELADSSNIFIDAGVYSHAQYGTWRFLPNITASIGREYSVRAFGSAYCRLLFGCSDEADTTTVKWEFRTEH
jgi:hypothetical protein